MLSPEEIETYLAMSDLVNLGIYKIVSRNAFVGIWLEDDQAFLISRYKGGCHPRVHYEYHWDMDMHNECIWRCGTAKPIDFIEQCTQPIDISLNVSQERQLLAYLDELEIKNPVMAGVNTLQQRRDASIKFQRR